MNSLRVCFVFTILFLTSCSGGLKDISTLKSLFDGKGTSKTSTKTGTEISEEVGETATAENPNAEEVAGIGTEADEVTGSVSFNGPIPEKSVKEVETIKLQSALQAESEYKIDDSEIDFLQSEGIVTEAEIAELQALK